MNILRLELKRVLKTRSTWILLLAAILISGIMAYFPISFVHYSYVDKNGESVTASGIKAVRIMKKNTVQGDITQDKIQKSVKNYQEISKQYGSIYEDSIPQDILDKKILPFRHIIDRLESVYADPQTKTPADLSKISPGEAAENFYKKYTWQIKSRVTQPSAQKQALALYEKVNKPFKFIYGFGSSAAADYLIILIFLLVFLCTFITAPVFSAEYQTGADNILRCTKYGRKKLAVSKIISAVLICSVTFAVCISIFLFIENSAFGWESLKTSIQSVTAICLPSIDVGQFEVITAAAGMLTLLATVSFTLFLSARCRNTVNSMIIAVVFCLMPLILSSISGSNVVNWIRMILPSGGAGIGNSFGVNLVELNFLRMGSYSFWSPYVMIISSAAAVPLFLILAALSYCKYESV
ncbi:ABC transporter permease subunit [uncultured Clostridium sp.]|uniref:ABC transporter permease subunit n=1 Tax=uncultured Clostridium sp. TaxID=59620 RepID=UPI0025F4DDFF|nr:ABC transporter permease subunit [uncultured Clostridium sp.]